MFRIIFMLFFVCLGSFGYAGDSVDTQAWRPVKIVRHGLGRRHTYQVIWQNQTGEKTRSSRADALMLVTKNNNIFTVDGYQRFGLSLKDANDYLVEVNLDQKPVAFIATNVDRSDGQLERHRRVWWNGQVSDPVDAVLCGRPGGRLCDWGVETPFVNDVPELVVEIDGRYMRMQGTDIVSDPYDDIQLMQPEKGRMVWMGRNGPPFIEHQDTTWFFGWGSAVYSTASIEPEYVVCDSEIQISAIDRSGEKQLVRLGAGEPLPRAVTDSQWMDGGSVCNPAADPEWDAATPIERLELIWNRAIGPLTCDTSGLEEGVVQHFLLGGRLVFRDGKFYVEEGAERGPALDCVLTLSEKEPVYIARVNDQEYLGAGIKLSEGHDWIGRSFFDAPRMLGGQIFMVVRDGDFYHVMYGAEYGPASEQPPHLMAVSPYGDPVYSIQVDGQQHMVWMDMVGPGFDRVSSSDVPVFRGQLLYDGVIKEGEAAGDYVVWGQESRRYDVTSGLASCNPVWSPGIPTSRELTGGYQVYYIARVGQDEFLVVDMMEGPAFDEIDQGLIFLEGGQIRYSVRCGEEKMEVVWGEEPTCR